MTDPVVKPVIPGLAPTRIPAGSGGALPLADVSKPDAGSLVAAVVTMDCNGRVIFAALDWPPRTQLDIRVVSGLILITADPHGVFRITRPGQVHIPAAARHRCGLNTGDRLLVTADAGLLVIHPPAVVARIIADLHTTLLDGGDRR